MSPDEFSRLAEVFAEPALLMEENGAILAANRALRQEFDLDPAPGTPLQDVVADDPARLRGTLGAWSRSREPLAETLTLRQPDRTLISCIAHGARVSPAGGPVRLAVRILPQDSARYARFNERIDQLNREIVRRLEVEEQLSRSQNRAVAILESITDCYVQCDARWRIVVVNRNMLEVLGKPPGELIGRPLLDVLADSVRDEIGPRLERAREQGQPAQFEAPLGTDGARWFEFHAHPTSDGFAIYLREITERKRLEEELRRRAEELATADERKNEYLAMLSHELRNPLAAIQTGIHVLQLHAGGNPVQERYVTLVGRQIGHMTRLVDDLLDVARIVKGAITLKHEVVDLAAVIGRGLELTADLVKQRKHRIHVSIPTSCLVREADETRLVEALANLLRNAATYMPPGGDIWVSLAADDSHAVIRVRDAGLGIEPQLQPRVFDLFWQGHRDLARSEGGLGIGLTLVRTIVELHGGTVEVHSAGPGRGSEFVIRLPGRIPSAPPRREVEPEIVSAPPPAQAISVLIVEDHEDAALALEEYLRLKGFEVTRAAEGATALRIADQHPPDAVLLDIGLPGLDGYEVARRLRESPRTRDAHIVSMTGYGRPVDFERSREVGIDHHLVKPVNPAELMRLLGSHPQAT